MAIMIDDPATVEMIRMLAERTGETVTDAIKQAVRERLERVPLARGLLTEEEIVARKRCLATLYAKSDAVPTIDDRTPDEIIGYNKYGHFD